MGKDKFILTSSHREVHRVIEWAGCNERKAFEYRRVRVDCEDYERLQR